MKVNDILAIIPLSLSDMQVFLRSQPGALIKINFLSLLILKCKVPFLFFEEYKLLYQFLINSSHINRLLMDSIALNRYNYVYQKVVLSSRLFSTVHAPGNCHSMWFLVKSFFAQDFISNKEIHHVHIHWTRMKRTNRMKVHITFSCCSSLL